MAPAAASATPLAPLAVISKSDQSGLIAIITALSLSFVLVSFLIRIHVRHLNGPWKTDDNVLTAATVVSFAQSVLVFFEINNGLGKADFVANPRDHPTLQKMCYASNILYILILFVSKASICFLYLRLTPNRRHIVIVRTILGVSAISAIMSIILLTVKCSWNGRCSNLFNRWIAISVIEMVTEMALVLFTLELVRGLQMRMGQKGIVVGAFASRLLVIPACALRLYYLRPSTHTSNQTLALSLAIVCTQLQLGYGVMAATIPCLKPFVTVYEKPSTGSTAANYYTAHSAKKTTYNSNTNKSAGSHSSHSIQLKSLPAFSGSGHRPQRPGRANSTVSITGPLSPTVSQFRPDAQETYVATISAPTGPVRDPKTHNINSRSGSHNRYANGVGRRGSRSGSIGDGISVRSHDSRRMIIERQTDWSVQYQHETGSLGDERSEEGFRD